MTASAVISIISALLAIAKFLTSYAEEQKWLKAGGAEATLKGLQDANAALLLATTARETIRSTIARDPASLRNNDEFKRPD